MKDYKGLLFLDIDGTLLRWSLFLYLVDKLIEAGIFNKTVKKRFAKEEQRWRERRGGYDDYLQKVIEIFESRIQDVYVDDFKLLAENMVEEYKNRVYRYTRDLIKEKLADDWYLVAISCSPKEAVVPFAKFWNIQEIFAAEIEQKNGKYTNRRTLPKNKLEIVKKVKNRPEFADLNQENIWGIGDGEADIGLLQEVGHPICFNPTLILRQEAEKRGWTVVVERKNVIYRF
ncbi:MAG TPA: haloacid dehalogenase-like hydrolase [Patescibacteria group bacterium]|nr:haloacid dehalogenase-like hydrolase [Patescibacteria group bacterium]